MEAIITSTFQSHPGSISTVITSPPRRIATGGFNPTLVRLARFAVPRVERQPSGFNPTLVRLAHPAPKRVLSSLNGFNPTLVRLAPSARSRRLLGGAVSIPPWFD